MTVKPTDAQRAANNSPFRRSLTKAQAAAAREWVLDSELTAEELLAEQRRLRAESVIAREQLGDVA